MIALAERSLLARTRSEWVEAETLAGQARAELHQAGIDESVATSLVCAVQARTALHRGDAAAARQQAVGRSDAAPADLYAAQPGRASPARADPCLPRPGRLSTHLQMQEIAAETYLSPHTVRAQGKSIYRKLDAASRGQAVARARELGLLEG